MDTLSVSDSQLVDDGFRMASCIQPYTSANSYQFPDRQHETAFNMAFQTTKPFYQYYHTVDKDRGRRFDSAMERYFYRTAQKPVENFFNFSKLPHDAIVVDVGGGRGHHSIRLSSQYSHIQFINQDRVKMDSTLEEIMDNDMMQRVTWQIHDYFMEQPVHGANVYLLSHILMDNPDSDACEILKHLFNAMMPKKSVLLIDDFLDPGKEGKLPLKANTLNLHLMAAFGRPFRTMDEWTVGNGRVLFTLMRVA
ncbi:S-adenosyl-L-methionine-dependent methyltransferase [Penicillium longicatenatum]|nr:S-adenosyl-L-methionine-dependent methyltransferase [Penicillium longicatenatum]